MRNRPRSLPRAAREARRFVLASGLVLSVACAAGPDGDLSAVAELSAGPDRVVAEVNGVPIEARRVQQVHQADLLRLAEQGETNDDEETGRDLDLVINAELIYQAALARGMTVPEGEIEERIDAVRSQFASAEAFSRHLREAGLSLEALRRNETRRLLVERYARSITDALVIDESEAERIYRDQRDRFEKTEQLRAAQIIVRALPGDPPARREAARRKIEEAARSLQAGVAFEQVAAEFSESPFAERGGDLGFFPRGRALPEFDDVVFALPVGEVTPVFETPHGFNIVKILERRSAGIGEFDDVKTGLLMVLAREQSDARLREHVEELRAAATIRILD